jgi:Reverse transcriptase (RNA-dependent DNA polymerase)
MDPSNTEYGRGWRNTTLFAEVAAMACGRVELEQAEMALVTLADDEPENYREAMKSANTKKWRQACEEEYNMLMGYHTWDLVEKPDDANIVGSRWVFRVKRDNIGDINKFKSRVVAQGYSQIAGVDFQETFSPTIRLTSIRLILALACKYNLVLQHINTKGAYLNGKLDDTVYMRQTEGFIKPGEENLVCKLNKGIYGLKRSGRVWHGTLKAKLEKLGFMAREADRTVFFKFSNNEIDIAGWYVDDGLLASISNATMDKMVTDIRGSFDIQDLGEPTHLLGMQIIRNPDLGTIHISQPEFNDTIARHFEITAGRTVMSPMDDHLELCTSTTPSDIINLMYASLIGSLNYCAVAT